MSAAELVEGLAARRWRVAFAESCTGGGLAQAITEVPGSSAVFELGLVTYSNRMKAEMLGITPALLAQHGAVSEACVEAMVGGLAQRSGAQLCAAVSGIAGPGGGSDEKPVGTVWLALLGPGCRVSKKFQFSGDRSAVRSASVETALAGLSAILKGVEPW